MEQRACHELVSVDSVGALWVVYESRAEDETAPEGRRVRHCEAATSWKPLYCWKCGAELLSDGTTRRRVTVAAPEKIRGLPIYELLSKQGERDTKWWGGELLELLGLMRYCQSEWQLTVAGQTVLAGLEAAGREPEVAAASAWRGVARWLAKKLAWFHERRHREVAERFPRETPDVITILHPDTKAEYWLQRGMQASGMDRDAPCEAVLEGYLSDALLSLEDVAGHAQKLFGGECGAVDNGRLMRLLQHLHENGPAKCGTLPDRGVADDASQVLGLVSKPKRGSRELTEIGKLWRLAAIRYAAADLVKGDGEGGTDATG